MNKRALGALYTATSVQIDCPRCGESLPAPCGSVFWTVDELAKAIADQPDRTCDGCDEPFVLRQNDKAYLNAGRIPPVTTAGDSLDDDDSL